MAVTCENYAQFKQLADEVLEACKSACYSVVYEKYQSLMWLYLADRDEMWTQEQLDESGRIMFKAMNEIRERELTYHSQSSL